jgi:glc operon protein GlcG
LLSSVFSSASYGQLLDKKAISLSLAKKIAAAGESEAARNNLAVVIAIVDDGGNLVYIEKMDNSQIGSIDIAIKKARTAIFFKRSTKSYEDRIAGGTNAILGLPEVLPFEGGLPLIVDGQYIGGIGVSGSTPQQDGIIVKAAVEVLN